MPKKLKFGVKLGWELGDKQLLTPLDVLVVEFELDMKAPGGDEAPLWLSLYEVKSAVAKSSPNWHCFCALKKF